MILTRKQPQCYRCGSKSAYLMEIEHRYVCNLCNHQVTAQQRRFRQYDLPGLLPDGYRLVSDRATRSLTLLYKDEVIEQQVFPFVEHRMVRHILAAAPDYCYFAELMSILSGDSQEHCQRVLDEACENSTTSSALKSVRYTISGLRKKLRLFGLDVHSCLGQGYVVMAVRQPAELQA